MKLSIKALFFSNREVKRAVNIGNSTSDLCSKKTTQCKMDTTLMNIPTLQTQQHAAPLRKFRYTVLNDHPEHWPTPQAVTVKRHINSNGYEARYDATQENLSRPVTMVIYNGDLDDEESLEQFIADVQQQARINHPGVPKIYIADVLRGRPFYLAEPLVDDKIVKTLPTRYLRKNPANDS